MNIELLENRRLLHSLTVQGSTLLVTGTDGADTFVFTADSTSFTVFPFEGSVAETPQTFQLSAINRIEVRCGGGNDKVNAEQIPFGMRIEGGGGRDTLLGGKAGDRIIGGSGSDILHGNGGNDNLQGSAGADHINGEGGSDTISYLGRPTGVTVNLGEIGGDGEAGENDNVASDVETVIGTDFADTIIAGGKRGYFFDGRGGADILTGGGGNDTLKGGLFPDSLTGNGGNDHFISNDDEGNGLFSIDQLWGGSGTDTANAGTNDEVHDIP
jgi:Ca2+-binding RTX toxin-like protein